MPPVVAADDPDRKVPPERLAGREGTRRLRQPVDHFAGRAVPLGGQGLQQTLAAELLIRSNCGFDQSVGKCDERVCPVSPRYG